MAEKRSSSAGDGDEAYLAGDDEPFNISPVYEERPEDWSDIDFLRPASYGVVPERRRYVQVFLDNKRNKMHSARSSI